MEKPVPVHYVRVWCKSLLWFSFLWLVPLLLGKYTDVTFPYIGAEDIPMELVGLVGPNEEGFDWCPIVSPHVSNKVRLWDNDVLALSDEEVVRATGVTSGGAWRPKECQSRYQVAIIIPYRNRTQHLQQFLTYMHPFLTRQQLNYRIVVVEQADDKPFNRAKLLNVGFLESGGVADCFIFHDVDLLPQNDLNVYACTHHPRHMYSAVDTFRYQLPYRRLFGGATAVQRAHFTEINGFANNFYGWGGEDDDLFNRLERKGLHVVRFDPRVSRYVMLSHSAAQPAPTRYQTLHATETRADGLSSLTYQLLRRELRPLYTWLFVAL